MSINKRALLQAGFAAGVLTAAAPRALAQAGADWRLGFANAPQAGYGPETLQLLRGRAPEGLSGVLYRNGPAWFRYPNSAVTHWFDGDGLVRRFAFQDGAVRHSGRFVDTPKRRAEQAADAAIMPGFGTAGRADAPVRTNDDANAANTSVLPVGNEVWALWEAGSPFVLDGQTLETHGARTFQPELAHMPFLAHPKVEPDGRIWNLGPNGDRTLIWRLGADGGLEAADLITLPQASYIHDWAMTERSLIILLQPWTYETMRPPVIDQLRWRPDAPMLIVVLEKADLQQRRVFEVPAMAFFHTGDAWEDADGTIHVDLCAMSSPDWTVTSARDVVAGRDHTTVSDAQLTLLMLRRDGTAQVRRTGMPGEFPQIDPRRQGQRRALTAMVTGPSAGRPGETGIALWDWDRGQADVFDFGPTQMVEEVLFVPFGPNERDAWLIGTSLNLSAAATELHVFDARAVADGPIATWRSAFAAPLGFHGAFAPRGGRAV